MSERKTIFSEDRVYRYTLWREWDRDLMGIQPMHIWEKGFEYVQFIALNPSTADEYRDDPTVRRCIDFAKRWGYGAMCMTNLFAIRATDPKVMMRHEMPIGERRHDVYSYDEVNDNWLLTIAKEAGLVIAAWGTKGSYLGRFDKVAGLIPKLHCIRKLPSGQPEHPLYLPRTLEPIPWP